MAQTAFGPMVVVAVEQCYPTDQRVVTDELAVRFLPAGMRLMVRACRCRWLRQALIKASDRQSPGAWGGLLGRKRFADDRVREALQDGIDQAVFLGAGLDTRAYRMVAPAGANAYELDQPENVAYLRTRLQAVFGSVPPGVRILAVDFESDQVLDALVGSGFRLDKPAIFVWEAVTQYLSEAGVRKTLALLAQTAPGSRLVFTYILKDFLDGTRSYGQQQLYRRFVARGRIWHFGLQPDAVAGILDDYGWTEQGQVGADEYAERYLEPVGRAMAVMAIERFVAAVKT